MIKRTHEPVCLKELRDAGRLVKRTFPDGSECELVEGIAQVKTYDPETRVAEIVASDETVDRYGDVIEAAGWDMTNFVSNPVVLVDHRYLVASIVGRAVAKVSGKELRATITLDDPEANPHAADVIGKLERGMLHAVSVGFLPFAWERILDDEGEWTYGYRYTEQELLEISWVAVPANPNATLGLKKQSEPATEPAKETASDGELLAARLAAASAAMI